MNRWLSYPRALTSGLMVLGLLAILSSGASLFASNVLVENTAVLALREIDDRASSQALRLVGYRQVSDASAALLTGEQRYAEAARSGSTAVRARLAGLEDQALDATGDSLVARIRTAEEDYRAAFELAVGAPGSHATAVATAAAGLRGRAFEQALDALVTHLEPDSGRGAASRASVKRTQAMFNAITWVSIILSVVLCAILMVVIQRMAHRQTGARLLAEEGQSRTSAALHEAKAAGRLKDEFLATISHELRNPLAPILTWTQLLRSGTLDRAKSDRGLEVIERNVVSLSELIDDLVDVSRVVSGKFRLDVRPIDLAPVIRAAVESQRPASEAKHIRLQIVMDERAGVISGDSERLQQVMGNLLSNAIKFTPKGRSVQVTLGRAESHVEISVADGGIGIEAEFLPHIFEPFQQAMDGTIRRHGGLGLGLSIVRHIVELHGGEIVAQSAGLGQGSRFTIKLPVLGTSAGAFAGRPRHPMAGDGVADIRFRRLDGVQVLIVDDEPTANEALQALLESCGARVRSASSAAQAIEMLDALRPDVLISDIAMPDVDGYALINQVRARSVEQGGDVPAAALTAYAKIEDRVRILSAGFQMYLSKPADPNELIAVVASLAARRPHVGANGSRVES